MIPIPFTNTIHQHYPTPHQKSPRTSKHFRKQAIHFLGLVFVRSFDFDVWLASLLPAWLEASVAHRNLFVTY
jgi:hypothetical protein